MKSKQNKNIIIVAILLGLTGIIVFGLSYFARKQYIVLANHDVYINDDFELNNFPESGDRYIIDSCLKPLKGKLLGIGYNSIYLLLYDRGVNSYDNEGFHDAKKQVSEARITDGDCVNIPVMCTDFSAEYCFDLNSRAGVLNINYTVNIGNSI